MCAWQAYKWPAAPLVQAQMSMKISKLDTVTSTAFIKLNFTCEATVAG